MAGYSILIYPSIRLSVLSISLITYIPRLKHTLVLIRHGESTWNQENKFTGWYDCLLSAKGQGEASAGGKIMAEENFKFSGALTSTLKRANQTLDIALSALGQYDIPVQRAWELNERHYGALQGLDKQETVNKYGIEQVNIWRRSYDVPPPECDLDSPHYPANDPKYAFLSKELCPRTESLKTTLEKIRINNTKVFPTCVQHLFQKIKEQIKT